MKKALIIIDMINDIVSENGKLASKGYHKQIKQYNVIENINQKIDEFRMNRDVIIFVNINFKKDYSDQNKNSPLFGKVDEFGIFEENSWGTKIFEKINKSEKDVIFIKNRVSAFFGTGLEEYLRKNNIFELYFCGCATDLAIESAVRDGHDRDFDCFVLVDCCSASDEDTHKNSIKTLSKIANII